MNENIKNNTGNYQISRDKRLIQLDMVCALLKQTYWASKRDINTIKKSIDNSICFGIYTGGIQIGFARVITDHATTYYLCDVIIDEAYRGIGLGRKLIDTIVHDEEFKDLSGMLITKHAHGLYEKYGFINDIGRFMVRKKNK